MVRKGARSSLQRESRRTAWLLYRRGASRFRLSILLFPPLCLEYDGEKVRRSYASSDNDGIRVTRESVKKPETIVSQI